MKNILFLTDFSEGSKNAIDYACGIFKEKEYNYFMLYVNKVSNYTTSSLLSDSKTVYASIVGDYKLKLKKLCSTLEKTYDKKFTSIIDYDSFIDAIKQATEKYNIDLLVAGYNGASNISEVVFGSNTLNIIRHIKTPSLIVPKIKAPYTATNILYLLDEEDDLQHMLNNQFIDHTTTSNYIVRVINNTNNATLIQKDTAILKNYTTLKYTYHTVYNIPLEYVKSYIMQTSTVDLTVLMVQDVSFFDRFFKGDATTKINKSLKKPLLVLH